MAKYDIAGLTVELNCQKRTTERAEKFKTDCTKEPDIVISTSAEEIAKINRPDLTEEIKAYLFEGKEFYKALTMRFNGMMLHSSCVVVDDKAYLFSAESGTGKSTHTRFWLDMFGDRAYLLNDDKPALRVFDDGVYAYGTPWSGKDDISVNKKVKVAGICFLERSETNWITMMSPEEIGINMYHGSVKKVEADVIQQTFKIINLIISKVPVYKMGCTPTVEAAEMSYNFMSKGEQK